MLMLINAGVFSLVTVQLTTVTRAALTHVLLKLVINIYFLTLGAIINSYGRDTGEGEPIRKEYGRDILQ